MFVLDASVALAWCFEDEATPGCWALLDSLEQGTAFAPAVWVLEVSNILVCAERRGRIASDKADEFLVTLKTLPIHVEPMEFGGVFNTVLMLARHDRLTTYDAAYLELAKRMRLPLATRDKALHHAALRHDVTLCPV